MTNLSSQSMSVAYLEKLNPEQRRAVEHGVREKACAPGAPLLVIAGAGSGKTHTLAHRVAHLIVNGVDPRRILLMTFSRRAASEMTRRVERIARQVMGDRAGGLPGATKTHHHFDRGFSGSSPNKSLNTMSSVLGFLATQ
jgi:superfamily I DNA/RNA helicase